MEVPFQWLGTSACSTGTSKRCRKGRTSATKCERPIVGKSDRLPESLSPSIPNDLTATHPNEACAQRHCDKTGTMDDSGSHPFDDQDRWNRLTEKQRACLDLLIEHKTSKEIARLLDISKHTVDQRLTTARDVLGAGDRNEAAFIYGRLKQTYDRMTYDAMGVPTPPILMRSEFPDGSPPNLMDLHESSGVLGRPSSKRLPFRGLWRRDHSSATRVWIYLGGLALTVWVILGGLGVAQALNQLLSR